MKGIPSFLLLVLSLIVYTNQFHLPDPDPSLSGPKLFNFQDQWISIASDPFANTKLRPIPPVNENWKDPNTIIFVTLPHYRDPRCATTVKNLLTKAKHPHRLRFGKLSFMTLLLCNPVLTVLFIRHHSTATYRRRFFQMCGRCDGGSQGKERCQWSSSSPR